MTPRRALLVAIAALLLAAAAAPAPALARTQSGGFVIERINDDEYPFVDVTVTVPEDLQDFSLSTDAFTITEDGQPRQPSLGADASARLTPPRVVLAIDVSGSMDPAIADARAAADAFVASLPEGSQVAVVTFGDDVDVVLDSTDDLGAVRAAIADIAVADVRAETALYDGVARAADLLPGRSNGPMSIIVLSDGEDTVSAADPDDAVATVADSDATLWAVQLEGSQRNPAARQALASDDGQVVTAANAGQLQGIYDDLASEISRRYLLRYESRADGPTEITVAVAWGTVSASQTREVDVAGRPAASREPPPVARPEV
ncbi:MAG TPA: VWA domain-containing protein, partial [Euzebyales bacterium]|nr:VWA domain-containing protein [Euzebyales bacterium]